MLNGQVEEVYSGHGIIKAFNKEESVIGSFDETNDKLYDSAWKFKFFWNDDAESCSLSKSRLCGGCHYGRISDYQKDDRSRRYPIFYSICENFYPADPAGTDCNMLQMTDGSFQKSLNFWRKKRKIRWQSFRCRLKIWMEMSALNVHFGYNADKIIINDFSADVKRRTKIAIVGPTGQERRP